MEPQADAPGPAGPQEPTLYQQETVRRDKFGYPIDKYGYRIVATSARPTHDDFYVPVEQWNAMSMPARRDVRANYEKWFEEQQRLGVIPKHFTIKPPPLRASEASRSADLPPAMPTVGEDYYCDLWDEDFSFAAVAMSEDDDKLLYGDGQASEQTKLLYKFLEIDSMPTTQEKQEHREKRRFARRTSLEH